MNFKRFYINGNKFSILFQYGTKRYSISFEHWWNNLMYKLTVFTSKKRFNYFKYFYILFLIHTGHEYELVWSSDEKLFATHIVSFNSHSWFMRKHFQFGWWLGSFLSIGIGYSNSFKEKGKLYTYRVKFKNKNYEK